MGTAPKPARVRAAKPAPVVEGDAPAASGAPAGTPATAIRRVREAPATARLAALEAALTALTARVAALEAAAGAPAADLTAVKAALVTAIEDVDAATRAGGLVPIPALRAELRRRGVAARDADVDAALEALEREWRIDLSVAQDPGQVADRAAGIERPGRGLLYYVARR